MNRKKTSYLPVSSISDILKQPHLSEAGCYTALTVLPEVNFHIHLKISLLVFFVNNYFELGL